jgi:hypothetical protein
MEFTETMQRLFEVEKKKIDDSIEENRKRLESLIQENISAAKSGVFFLQAVGLLKEKNFPEAARDFAYAADLAFSGHDHLNGQRAMSSLIEQCLPQLNKSNFDTFADLDRNIDTLLTYLESHNEHGRFIDAISSIKQGRTNAKNKST